MRSMQNYHDAKISYVRPEDVKGLTYHDIDYKVLESRVRLLKDHPRQDLPPILLSAGMSVLDGRHRLIAYVHAERDAIPAIILKQ